VATTNITTPLDGHAYLEYDLLLPSGPSSIFNPLVRFIVGTFSESVYSYAQANVGIQTLNTDYADRVLKSLDANGTPVVRLRLGQGVPDHIDWTPWQLHYVRNYKGAFTGIGSGAGHQINIHTEDMLSCVDRASRTSAYRGKVSDIVQNIATRNGISDVVIEPTKSEGVWIQSFCGDFEFVRKRLLRIARSDRGRGNYCLFSRDNVLHFHTADYQADVKEMTYYNSSAGRLELSSLPQEKIDSGSAGVRLVGHDPYTGQSQEANSSPAEAIRFANWISRIDTVNGAQLFFPFHLGENRGMEALNLTQNRYEAARQECYQLKMLARKTTLLRAGDILNLELEPKSGQASTWTGLWQVASANHTIEKGEITSVYFLQRGELAALKGVSNALLSQGINLVVDEQNAPGVPLNLQQTQVSQLTKGAGKAVGAGIFSKIQDPQKALVPPPPSKPFA
jgi:hypothetical protein